MTATLDELQVGQRGRVERIAGSDRLVQRLCEMGLTEGEPIELVGLAPLGDPMEIRIRGYLLSLRKSEASAISVRLEGASG